jgi:hypothetical protein
MDHLSAHVKLFGTAVQQTNLTFLLFHYIYICTWRPTDIEKDVNLSVLHSHVDLL